jgi:NAD-dependent deacetylase
VREETGARGPAIDDAVAILVPARRVVVTTGAGMSKESGIPTFRDAPNALWADFNPEDLATREGFRRDPARVWRWYAERRAMIARARAHAGHKALARLETLCDDFLLLTQNIDGLHHAAGSRHVVELHGNIFRFRCFENDHPAPAPAETDEVPPRCACGSFLRPDVVWFGEALAAADLDRAYSALSACEVLLVVGTSGLVYPAAGFADLARAVGARVIEVNPDPTPLSDIADVTVRSGAKEALPEIVRGLERARRAGA